MTIERPAQNRSDHRMPELHGCGPRPIPQTSAGACSINRRRPEKKMAVRRPGQIEEFPMSKTHPLGFRIEREIKEALVKAAKDDHRSVSSLVELVIARWLKERGYLGEAKDKAA